ncbi:sodium:proton exchanger [Tsukamurella sputi]|uniref:Sodium:proton exchanger n=1 Tax=Tsukamurella sputi TaxID=2591848 RepID=A0A5C5RJS6_9ACTN|nr:cation:proton antiporter [Tsukamurella sputi]TWS22884.1 sodium:proton exchanger [Tsukamurella sputi]
MNAAVLTVIGAIVLRSLFATGLARWNVGAPVAMVVAGAVVAAFSPGSFGVVGTDTVFVQHAAEIILAVLLFVDATEVKGRRLWGRWPGLVGRTLFVAMPVALALAVGAGALLFPGQAFGVLLILACIVIPIDFAPADNVVRDHALPAKVRSVLNVESGYNDGLVSPVFLFALALIGGRHAEAQSPLGALGSALPSSAIALVVGVLMGALLAVVMDWATERDLTTVQSRRIIVLLMPVMVYFTTVAVDGNGFVAAFAAGTAYRYVYRGSVARRLRRLGPGQSPRQPVADSLNAGLLEDVTLLLTMVMWFVVGLATAYLFVVGISWQQVLYCVLALTVIRVLSILIGLAGSSMSVREQLLVGALGPRGTTSIVFGLLAFNSLPDGPISELALSVTVLCVLGSVLLHGMGAGPLTRKVSE